jgi:hypothetical protein
MKRYETFKVQLQPGLDIQQTPEEKEGGMWKVNMF